MAGFTIAIAADIYGCREARLVNNIAVYRGLDQVGIVNTNTNSA